MPIQAVRQVVDYDNDAFHYYRTLKHGGEHRRAGVLVAEGAKVVSRLLASPLEIVSILLSEEWFARLKSQIEARSDSIDIWLLDKPGMEALTGRTCYQPLKAVACVPPPFTLDDVVAERPKAGVYAAIEGLSNAENVGAVVRNCVGLGVAGLFVDQSCSSPFLRRAVHASMGTVFRLPFLEDCRLPSVLKKLRSRGISIIAAHPSASQQTLAQAEMPEKVCVVLGSEGEGLSREVLDCCDLAVSVPMAQSVDSLNVACASAVYFYELQRRLGRM